MNTIFIREMLRVFFGSAYGIFFSLLCLFEFSLSLLLHIMWRLLAYTRTPSTYYDNNIYINNNHKRNSNNSSFPTYLKEKKESRRKQIKMFEETEMREKKNFAWSTKSIELITKWNNST